MSEAQHTPGPWTASPAYECNDYCIHARGIPWQLAYLAEHSRIEWPLEANARLIAAAPEMLDALKKIDELGSDISIEGLSSYSDLMRAGTIARAAIAKAEGRS